MMNAELFLTRSTSYRCQLGLSGPVSAKERRVNRPEDISIADLRGLLEEGPQLQALRAAYRT